LNSIYDGGGERRNVNVKRLPLPAFEINNQCPHTGILSYTSVRALKSSQTRPAIF
jgi:hypothetical protein